MVVGVPGIEFTELPIGLARLRHTRVGKRGNIISPTRDPDSSKKRRLGEVRHDE